LKNVLSANREFHNLLSLEEKIVYRTKYHRGYVPINTSTLYTSTVDKVTLPNQSDSFIICPSGEGHIPDDVPLMAAGPNYWPNEEKIPGFKEKTMKYGKAATNLAIRLASIVALALGLPEDGLSHFFVKGHLSWLRLMCYPPHPIDAPPDLYGSAPHCDYGLYTLVHQDSTGGLKIQQKGQWFDIPAEEDALVLNSGDMLHRLSNGRFKATPHCVKNKSHTHHRHSVVFFFDSYFHTTISPIVRDQEVKKFDDVVYGDYLMERLLKNYNRLK